MSSSSDDANAIKSSFDLRRASAGGARKSLSVEMKEDQIPKHALKGCEEFMLSAKQQVDKVAASLQAARAVHVKAVEEGLKQSGSPTARARDEASLAAATGLRQDMQEMVTLCKDVLGQPALSLAQKSAVMEHADYMSRACDMEVQLLEDGLNTVPVSIIDSLVELLDQGVKEYSLGFSPLHWAAHRGRTDVLEFLLSRGDVASQLLLSRDDFGCTPLAYAMAGNVPHLLQRLREAGADQVPAHQPRAPRPDISALSEKTHALLECVEENGWAYLRWREGRTLLHWAAEKNLEEMCVYLLHHLADLTQQDRSGQSALDCAVNMPADAQARLTMLRDNRPCCAFEKGATHSACQGVNHHFVDCMSSS
eukprot:6028090-Amphidinium_carterae.1